MEAYLYKCYITHDAYGATVETRGSDMICMAWNVYPRRLPTCWRLFCVVWEIHATRITETRVVPRIFRLPPTDPDGGVQRATLHT